MSNNLILPARRTDNKLIKEVEGELILYDTHSHKGICLNSSMRIIWENLDGRASASEIVAKLRSKGRKNYAESDVVDAILLLVENDLADDTDLLLQDAPDLKRRTTISKIFELGSAAGATISVFNILPAYAQASCVPKFDPCMSDDECCPGCHCNGAGFCAGGC